MGLIYSIGFKASGHDCRRENFLEPFIELIGVERLDYEACCHKHLHCWLLAGKRKGENSDAQM